MRLNNICDVARGGSPRPIKDYITEAKDGVNWIKIGDTEIGGKYITSTKEKIKPSGVSKSRFVKEGDFLLTNSMSFGRPYILKTCGCIHDGWLVISPIANSYNTDFLYNLLSSQFAKNQFIGKVTGAVVKNLNSDKVANSLFPLPPLEEQKRIGERIESISSLWVHYEQLSSDLHMLNESIKDRLKKSILQEAIQGKLVPQIESEGTAEELLEEIRAEKKRLVKEGKLKKSAVTNESRIFRGDDNKYREKNGNSVVEIEMPFDIPESWSWIRLGDLFSHNTGKALNGKGSGNLLRKYLTTSNLYWDSFDLTKVKEMYFSETEIDKCTIAKGDLLICEGGDVGRAAIWNEDYSICIQNHIHRLRSYYNVCTRFFYYVIRHYKTIGLIGGKGIGIQGLSSKSLHDIIIPLPPVEEQYRISNHLDYVLASIMSR